MDPYARGILRRHRDRFYLGALLLLLAMIADLSGC
jgi:hypothetical protein